MKLISLIRIAIICLPAFAGVAVAAGVEIDMKVEKVVTKTDADGNVTTEHVAPEITIPGDVMIYTTRYSNKGADQADNVSIVTPIPKETRLVSGSLQGEAQITFSVDGGKNFDTPDKLRVLTKAQELRPAGNDDYTHIRWLIPALPSGETGAVSFQTRIRED